MTEVSHALRMCIAALALTGCATSGPPPMPSQDGKPFGETRRDFIMPATDIWSLHNDPENQLSHHEFYDLDAFSHGWCRQLTALSVECEYNMRVGGGRPRSFIRRFVKRTENGPWRFGFE